MENKIDEKIYFKVYDKYLSALGEDKTDNIDLEFIGDTKAFLERKAEEYQVSIDAIIGGYLEQYIQKLKDSE